MVKHSFLWMIAVGALIYSMNSVSSGNPRNTPGTAQSSLAVQQGIIPAADINNALKTGTTAAGVQLVNNTFGSIAKKQPTRIITKVNRQPGETMSQYNRRFNEIIPSITGNLAREFGGVSEISLRNAARVEQTQREITEGIKPRPMDITPGASTIEGFDAILQEAREKASSGEKSSKWKTNLQRAINNVRSSIQQGARLDFKSGKITYDQFQSIANDAIARADLARQKLSTIA